MSKKKIEEIRKWIANYMVAEGCGCCRDYDGHEKAQEKLAKLLDVPKYDDDSGYDFYKFAD